MSTAPTRWPKGVIARYLTVGGATVDITPILSRRLGDPPYELKVACTGCPGSKTIGTYRTEYDRARYGREVHDPEGAERDARQWAQSHADICRAMPKPDGAA